ncbi:MAG TPA: guanosine monophosphate reductase [Dehalococcoidia bacterium]|jgi:IMP dehydrogenase|nr:guanosine monophosphate reductase [Dehalococcoidia bacterium]
MLERKMFKRALSFDDVLLRPLYSSITTRSDVDTTVQLDRNITMRMPLFAAPMDTIMSSYMACAVDEAGGIGILHRYCSIQEQVEMLRSALTYTTRREPIVFAAVGVTNDYMHRIEALIEAGIAGICVDVAHGHNTNVIKAIENIRGTFPRDLHIMAGNVATLKGFSSLAEAGADSIRVGIGGGSICSTRIQTGHGIPTFESVLECSRSEHDAILIADGGIKNSGDIVKALAAGADAVMVGRLLAGTIEAPGEIIHNPPHPPRKVYRGMASIEAQRAWRGKSSSNEGVSRTVPSIGPVKDILMEIDRGIRSGLSYSGARNILELQAKAEFITQSSAGMRESSTHIDS